MFDAVIFDLDGTLLDTEGHSQSAGLETFAAHGIAVDTAFLHGMIGQDDETTEGVIRNRWPDLDFEAFRATWRQTVNRNYATGIPMKPGAESLLAQIRLPKALATSSTRVQCDHKLELTGIGPHFLHVVTFNDVENAKPAPDPFLLAAKLLNIAPSRCLVFEDSEPGAQAAYRAGMTVVQVPDILPSSGRFAHLVAPDLLTGARQIGLLTD
jgi:HAD superfamily hydrolase (TIGR01509 family)